MDPPLCHLWTAGSSIPSCCNTHDIASYLGRQRRGFCYYATPAYIIVAYIYPYCFSDAGANIIANSPTPED